MRRTPTIRFLLATLAVALLLPVTGAQAATVTIGSPLTGAFEPTTFNTVGLVSQTALPEPGVQLTSPVSGTIVRWRLAEPSGGPFTLRVLRPAGGNSYTAVGSTGPITPSGSGTVVLPARLPIMAGDKIGLENAHAEDKIGILTPVTGAAFLGWTPSLAEGETRPAEESVEKIEVGFNADVLPPPTVTALTPSSGSFTGGTPVTITGTDFVEVTDVSFGSTPAASFSVSSDTQISAVAPAAAPGATDVVVTTVAGASPIGAGDRFEYAACRVPGLAGLKLKAAKKKLKKASCGLGRVRKLKGATAKTGRVKKQGPKAGRTLAPGTKVSLTLR